MKFPLTPPKFPEDFRVLHADGGASYWHWHPDAPPDYDGTWLVAEMPPPWAGGLQISTADGAQAELDADDTMIVVWEFGPELESGPYHECGTNVESVQWTVDAVIAEVNEEHELSSGMVSRP